MVTLAFGYALAYRWAACWVPASPYWWYHWDSVTLLDEPLPRPVLEPHAASAPAAATPPDNRNSRRRLRPAPPLGTLTMSSSLLHREHTGTHGGANDVSARRVDRRAQMPSRVG